MDASTKPTRVSGVEQEELETEIVVYHPDNGKVYNLNGTGAFIWSLCNGTHSLEKIATVIHDEAPRTDYADIMDDVRGFVMEMKEEGLLRNDSVAR